jgi:hypothetical protein
MSKLTFLLLILPDNLMAPKDPTISTCCLMKKKLNSADPGNPDPMIEKLLLLLHDSSRTLAELTADMVYGDPGLMAPLLSISRMQDPFAQRASRIVCMCVLRFPELIRPYSTTMINELEGTKSLSVIRNYLKIFAEAPVRFSGKDKAILVNCCFGYLLSRDFPVGIKMFSMQVLYNLSREIPEISIELAAILADQLPGSSPGFKSRAGKILKKLGHFNKKDFF